MAERGRVSVDFARLELAQLEIDADGSIVKGLAAAAQISAKCLHVDRVGFWIFVDSGRRLHCIHQLDTQTERPNVADLFCDELPAYFRALQEHRFIVADDARSDPATHELTESYLVPLGITSMLDAPVYRGHEVIGIVCHEHTGEPRQWTREEQHLAATTADVVAMLCEQSRRLAAQKALQEVEAKQRELELLDDLVRISAGIAHDLNNLLSAVMTATHLLERRADDPAFVRSSAADLTLMSEQGARLVQQLVTLRRSLEPPSEPIDVVRLVRTLEPVLGSVARGCALEIHTRVAEAWVLVDARIIEQVLVNLLTNASDASDDNAVIELSLDAAREGDHDWVSLSVRDEGRGMDASVVKRATEPFFTTRPAEGGTGLGLDIVATMVRQHHGELRIDSAPGRGTRVDVLLPRADPPV